MARSTDVPGVNPDPVRAVYHPIPVAWLFLILAPLGIVTVAVILTVRAVLITDDTAFRVISALWSLFAFVTVYRLVTGSVVRAELTDTLLRWRTLGSRGDLPLADVRSVHTAPLSGRVIIETASGRRLSFARGPAVRDLVADVRRAVPHLDVELPARASRESILDPFVERRLHLERRALFEYRRTD